MVSVVQERLEKKWDVFTHGVEQQFGNQVNDWQETILKAEPSVTLITQAEDLKHNLQNVPYDICRLEVQDPNNYEEEKLDDDLALREMSPGRDKEVVEEETEDGE